MERKKQHVLSYLLKQFTFYKHEIRKEMPGD